jgi:hypothetical protein
MIDFLIKMNILFKVNFLKKKIFLYWNIFFFFFEFQRHGYGVLRDKNGELYNGDWEFDLYHGQGRLRN